MPSQTIYVLYLCISSLNTGDGNFKTQFCNDGKRSDQNEISPAVTSEMGRDPFLIGNESWEIEREREREREEGFVFRTRSTQRLKWRMVKWRKSLLPIEAKNSFERDLRSSGFCEKNAVAAGSTLKQERQPFPRFGFKCWRWMSKRQPTVLCETGQSRLKWIAWCSP